MSRDPSDLLASGRERNEATHKRCRHKSVPERPCIVHEHARLNGASCGLRGVQSPCLSRIRIVLLGIRAALDTNVCYVLVEDRAEVDYG